MKTQITDDAIELRKQQIFKFAVYGTSNQNFKTAIEALHNYAYAQGYHDGYEDGYQSKKEDVAKNRSNLMAVK